MAKHRFLNRFEIELKMAQPADIPAIEALYQDFSGENMARITTLDKTVVKESIVRMVSHGAIILACIKDKAVGFVAGYVQNCHFSNDVMFTLMYFFVNQKHRQYSAAIMKLLEELIRRNTNVTKFVVSSPAFEDHEKLDRFYEISGYKLLEKHYYKEIERVSNVG